MAFPDWETLTLSPVKFRVMAPVVLMEPEPMLCMKQQALSVIEPLPKSITFFTVISSPVLIERA